MLAKYRERRRTAARTLARALDDVDPDGSLLWRAPAYAFITLLGLLKNVVTCVVTSLMLIAVLLTAVATVPFFTLYVCVDMTFMSAWFLAKAMTKR